MKLLNRIKMALRKPPANALFVIRVELADDDIWQFDYPKVGLFGEPFVEGVPEIIEEELNRKGMLKAAMDDGFTCIFSAERFPSADCELHWLQGPECGGHWYTYLPERFEGGDQEPMKGWLCPALFKFFRKPPKTIFIQIQP